MSDPRVLKLAKVLVNYSVDIKPGQQLQISADPIASELTLAVCCGSSDILTTFQIGSVLIIV